MEFVTDSKANYDISHTGDITACKTLMCDLFKFIFQDTELKVLIVVVRWMPSHLQKTHIDEGRSLPEGISLRDAQAIDHTDSSGNQAAKGQVIDKHIST